MSEQQRYIKRSMKANDVRCIAKKYGIKIIELDIVSGVVDFDIDIFVEHHGDFLSEIKAVLEAEE